MFTSDTYNGTAVHQAQTAGRSRPLLYDVTGHGDPIVLVPGTLTGWASWRTHAERLAASRKVVRVQLRNVELAEASIAIPETYSVESEIDGLLAAADELGLDRFDLVGWSLGGLVSLAFALRFPDRVKTLTVIEPAATWVLRASGITEAWLDDLEARDRELTGKDISVDDLKTFLHRAGVGSGDEDLESHPSWPLMVRNRQVLSVVGTVWDHADSMEALRNLAVPLLVVMGASSPYDIRLQAEMIAREAPHATVLELPGNHTCHIEHMDQFLAALETHLLA